MTDTEKASELLDFSSFLMWLPWKFEILQETIFMGLKKEILQNVTIYH
jgi:hypothetical protein